MGGWYILGAVLALLALLLALPAGVRVRWDGQPLVLLRLGPLRFQLLPPKKKKKPEKPAKDAASPEKKAKKEKKPRPKFNREQLLYSIDRGLHLIGKLLVRFRGEGMELKAMTGSELLITGTIFSIEVE